MTKKLLHKNENHNIHAKSLEQIISDRFGKYSKYTIQDRALPDVRDGLKPVQRRILYSMYELGLYHNKPYKKSARVVGEVIGKYHPHGDTSIYDALIRLSQEWKMNIPLIEVHGNKGSIDDDPAAAMRYTETRLSKIGEMMLQNLDKKSVKFAPNFDDSEVEPTVLPTLIPNLLLNGCIGIASGYATEMPPHNLTEIINAVIAKIENPTISLKELSKIIKGPDFPTGGIIQGKLGIYQAFETGNGKISIKAKLDTVIKGNKKYLKITELPFGVIKSKLIRQIDEIIHYQQINGIKYIRDESDREYGIKIIIGLSQESDHQTIINYLFIKSDLQIYYNYNNVVIKNRAPVTLGLIGLIESYLEHQKDVQTASLKFDLAKNERRYEILLGFIKASKISDKIITLIKKTTGSKLAVVEALKTKLHFSTIQAEAIAELKLYRLSKTDQEVFDQEKGLLEKNIQKISDILHSKKLFNQYLIDLLINLRNEFKTPRKTQIQNQIEKVTIDVDSLIKNEETWIGISKDGYIKRFSNRVYESNDLTSYTLKLNDGLIYFYKVNTIDKLLIFTSKGRFIFLPIHKIDEVKWKDFGKHLNDYVTIQPNEQVINAIVVNDFNLNLYLTFITKNGKGKRVLLKAFYVTRFSKPMQCIKLSKDDFLISVYPTNDKKQIVIMTKKGFSVRYNEKELPVYSLNSVGVKAINLTKDDEVVVSLAVNANNVIGLVSNRGGFKRIRAYNILPMNKTTKGKPFFRVLNKNNHQIIDAKVVEASTNVYLIPYKGNHKIINFKQVDLSNNLQGFSMIMNQKILHANIMQYIYLDNQSPLLRLKIVPNFDQDFNDAEEIVNQVTQVINNEKE